MGTRMTTRYVFWTGVALLVAGAVLGGPDGIVPGEIWADDNGVHVNAHGGGVLEEDGVYWWYGEDKGPGSAGNRADKGVHVYSSRDLVNWKPNAARCFRARSLAGPWESLGNPCRGVNPQNGLGPEKTWGCQSTFLLPDPARPGSFIAMFDMWRPKNAIDGRYVWLPVEFSPEGWMVIEWRDAWRPQRGESVGGRRGCAK